MPTHHAVGRRNCKRVGWHYIAVGTVASPSAKDLRREKSQKSLFSRPNCGSWARYSFPLKGGTLLGCHWRLVRQWVGLSLSRADKPPVAPDMLLPSLQGGVLGQQLVDDRSGHVGEAKISSLESIRQPQVVQAEEMEQGRVEVV